VDPKDISLADYIAFFGNAPGGRAVRWQIAQDQQERLVVLEEALAHCYSSLIDTRGLNADSGEDELTMQVANMLTAAGIEATHDRHINGHCDVIVEADRGFMWLGEAKVHKDYGWLQDGFLQLSTRYGTAMAGRDRGELIIYHRGGDAIKVLATWKKKLLEEQAGVAVIEDLVDPSLFFRTSHKCPNSGCTFYVRHSIVPLMHAPGK